MAFSSTPQETVKEFTVLLDIADKLSILLDDKKRAEIIKDVEGLTASEKAMAEEARDSIAQYQSLIAEQGKRKQALDAFHDSLLSLQENQKKEFDDANAELDEKKAASNAALTLVADGNKSLDAREKALNGREADLIKREKDLAIASTALDVKAENLRNQESDLAARKQEVDDYEASLKATGAQLQQLTKRL